MIFDNRTCDLGEGVVWHPERQQVYWFDILNRRLMWPGGAWEFPEIVSAIGWVDRDQALVAAESGLLMVNLATQTIQPLAPVAAGQPATRSNDGRADRQGGFWWGTMGKRGDDDPGLGAIWRWYRGELRCLYPGITIPNAICFAADGSFAHFTDTVTQKVMKVALDADGWPKGQPEVFLDLGPEGRFPDGAVIDAEGVLWLAEWGSSRVAAYGPDGRFLRAVAVGAPHSSCPAFGGADLSTLYVTTARQGMSAAALAACPDAGKTFAIPGVGRGLPEARVRL